MLVVVLGICFTNAAPLETLENSDLVAAESAQYGGYGDYIKYSNRDTGSISSSFF